MLYWVLLTLGTVVFSVWLSWTAFWLGYPKKALEERLRALERRQTTESGRLARPPRISQYARSPFRRLMSLLIPLNLNGLLLGLMFWQGWMLAFSLPGLVVIALVEWQLLRRCQTKQAIQYEREYCRYMQLTQPGHQAAWVWFLQLDPNMLSTEETLLCPLVSGRIVWVRLHHLPSMPSVTLCLFCPNTITLPDSIFVRPEWIRYQTETTLVFYRPEQKMVGGVSIDGVLVGYESVARFSGS